MEDSLSTLDLQRKLRKLTSFEKHIIRNVPATVSFTCRPLFDKPLEVCLADENTPTCEWNLRRGEEWLDETVIKRAKNQWIV